jgi:vacuolar-type H+-ATPase subunit E/Vma4
MEKNTPLIDKIIKDAEEEAENIIKRSQQAAEESLKLRETEAKQKARTEAARILESAQEEAARIRRSMLADAKIRVNWGVLVEKEKLIDQTLELVMKELVQFTKSPAYNEFLEKISVASAKLLNGGEIELILNERDANLHLDVSKIAKKVTVETGAKKVIKLSSERHEGCGGVIMKSSDGRIVVNNTLDNIFARQAVALRLKIASELFAS